MTNDEIDKLVAEARERAEKATPGPWCCAIWKAGNTSTVAVSTDGGSVIAELVDENDQAVADGKLMTASRTDISSLCDAVEQLQRELAAKDAEIVRLRKRNTHLGASGLDLLNKGNAALYRAEAAEAQVQALRDALEKIAGHPHIAASELSELARKALETIKRWEGEEGMTYKQGDPCSHTKVGNAGDGPGDYKPYCLDCGADLTATKVQPCHVAAAEELNERGYINEYVCIVAEVIARHCPVQDAAVQELVLAAAAMIPERSRAFLDTPYQRNLRAAIARVTGGEAK